MGSARRVAEKRHHGRFGENTPLPQSVADPLQYAAAAKFSLSASWRTQLRMPLRIASGTKAGSITSVATVKNLVVIVTWFLLVTYLLYSVKIALTPVYCFICMSILCLLLFQITVRPLSVWPQIHFLPGAQLPASTQHPAVLHSRGSNFFRHHRDHRHGHVVPPPLPCIAARHRCAE